MRKLNVKTKTWTKMHDLKKPMVDTQVGNKIKEKWTPGRKNHACAFHPGTNGNKAYVIVAGGMAPFVLRDKGKCKDGCDSAEVLKSTEVYYLDGGNELDGDMIEKRQNYMLVTDKNKIYALGGSTVSNFLLDSVEEWRDSTKTWVKASWKLKVPRVQFGAVVVDGKMICPSD